MTCPHCQKENDPVAPRCWSCHTELKDNPFFGMQTAAVENMKPVPSDFESATRNRYLELTVKASKFIESYESDLNESELELFFEIVGTIWRMKK